MRHDAQRRVCLSVGVVVRHGFEVRICRITEAKIRQVDWYGAIRTPEGPEAPGKCQWQAQGAEGRMVPSFTLFCGGAILVVFEDHRLRWLLLRPVGWRRVSDRLSLHNCHFSVNFLIVVILVLPGASVTAYPPDVVAVDSVWAPCISVSEQPFS